MIPRRQDQALWRQLRVLLLLLLWGGVVQAALVAVESGVEVRLDTVQIPERSPAPLRLRPCSICPQLNLALTRTTAWYLADDSSPISQGEWLRVAATGPPAPLVYVFYRPGTLEVTRVILDLAGGSR